jgi:hypothetical protein
MTPQGVQVASTVGQRGLRYAERVPNVIHFPVCVQNDPLPCLRPKCTYYRSAMYPIRVQHVMTTCAERVPNVIHFPVCVQNVVTEDGPLWTESPRCTFFDF